MPKTVIIRVKSKKDIKKRKPTKRKMAKKGNKNDELFSGKVLGFEIPGVKDVLKNKTAQKVLVGAGIVSVGLALVNLINNPTLNKFAAKKEVRVLAAAAGGDIPGAAFQLLKEDPNILGKIGNRGMSQSTEGLQMVNREGFA